MNVGKQVFTPICSAVESKLQEMVSCYHSAANYWEDMAYDAACRYVNDNVRRRGENYINTLQRLSDEIDRDIERMEHAMSELNDENW